MTAALSTVPWIRHIATLYLGKPCHSFASDLCDKEQFRAIQCMISKLSSSLFSLFIPVRIQKKKKLIQKSYCDSGDCQAHKPAIHASEAPDVQLQLYVMVFLSCLHVQGGKNGFTVYGMALQVNANITAGQYNGILGLQCTQENVSFCFTSAINNIEYSQNWSALRNSPVKLQTLCCYY